MADISRSKSNVFHIRFDIIDPLEERDWIAINKLLNTFKRSDHVDLHYHEGTDSGENSWFIKINGIYYHFTSLFDIVASFFKIEHNESLIDMLLTDSDLDKSAPSYFQDFISITRILSGEILPYGDHKLELVNLLKDRHVRHMSLTELID